MKNVILGEWSEGGPVKLDFERLLLTRMLVQANSGNGKSWLLRRLFEVTAGLVQQLIIDPEGEFSSLREKHDLVIIAATGGDAAAHPRTAALLAIRLLETRASAVLDISELKAHDRHAFVRIFFESLIEAPKALRHPVLVALDEAQIFAPEKGQGESEASAAVIDLATRGRKRGLCLVAATQRISMFHKGVAAELKNRLIGGTSLDVDVKRAAFDLGMPAAEALKVLRALEPGHFFAFGPALKQLEPRVFVAGPVETSHPKVGHKQAAPPAPTKAILALLPQLADLPKEAEEHAKSLDDMRRELAQVKRDLTLAKKAVPTETISKTELVAEFKRGVAEGQSKGVELAAGQAGRQFATQRKRLVAVIEDLMKFIVKINASGFAKDAGVEPKEIKQAMEVAIAAAMKSVERSAGNRESALLKLQSDAGRLIAAAQKLLADDPVEIAIDVKRQEAVPAHTVVRQTPERAPAKPADGGDPNVTGVQQRILNALAELEALNSSKPPRELVALLADYTNIKSTGFVKAMGQLSTAGLVEYPSAGEIALTDAGRAIAVTPDQPRSTEELQARIMAMLGGATARVLKPLVEAYPQAMDRQTVAIAAGYGNLKSTGFVKAMGQLSTLGFIRYPNPGSVVAKPVLFLEGA